MRVALPIDDHLPRVVDAARRGPVVLRAETGAGKTTRVPPALLPHVGTGAVWLLEPRRVAARAAARRIADEGGWQLGAEVGFQIRGERVAGPATRILVVTEGVLLRRLADDPELTGIGAVVVDEFHERGLDVDLALALLRQVREALRPDLLLVAMSATVDAGPLAAWLGATALDVPGRTFPVAIRYLPRPDDRAIPEQVAEGVRASLSAAGDLLAFLPGVREILRTADLLTGIDAQVVPLYGDLPPAAQDAALRPGSRRRVILATNVAETSLTLPGVRAVVDSGWARVARQDPATGLDQLLLERISVASADQRAGRAGREAPGVCLRLWTERAHQGIPAWPEPEIRRVDLAGPVLQLLAWGEPDPGAFPWFEAPTPTALGHARRLLDDLGATDGGRLTALGRTLARAPLHPRLARILLEAESLGVGREAALLAGVLSERRAARPGVADARELLRDPSPAARAAAESVLRGIDARRGGGDLRALDRAILAGWPDRVARTRPDGKRARMTGGRGLRLPDDAPAPAWFVAIDLEGSGPEATVRALAPIEPSWLTTAPERSVAYDPEVARVVAVERDQYRDLTVRERPLDAPRDAVEAALAEAAAAWIGDIQPDDPDYRAWEHRLAFAARAAPEAGLPTPDAAWRTTLLPALCRGARGRADLSRADWLGAARAAIGWATERRLDALAPERVTVPSGSAIRIDYDSDPPVLAVKIQELFGWAETPRIADGRVRLRLHLLAPNGRPQQITEDLRGFWDRTWPEVRKELRARYPKHGWPEDPWTAVPRARPSRSPNAR